MPRLAGAGSLCHNKSNTLQQQQHQLADVLVQVPLNNCVACCRVAGGVVAVPLGYVFLALYILATAQFLSLLLDV